MSRVCEALCAEAYEAYRDCERVPRVSKEPDAEKHVNVRETKVPPVETAYVKTSHKPLTMRQYAFFLTKNYPHVEVGRQRLYDWFRREGVIPKNSRIPAKRYIAEGLFEVRYADTASPNQYEPVAMISPRGQQLFTNSILNEFQRKTA